MCGGVSTLQEELIEPTKHSDTPYSRSRCSFLAPHLIQSTKKPVQDRQTDRPIHAAPSTALKTLPPIPPHQPTPLHQQYNNSTAEPDRTIFPLTVHDGQPLTDRMEGRETSCEQEKEREGERERGTDERHARVAPIPDGTRRQTSSQRPLSMATEHHHRRCVLVITLEFSFFTSIHGPQSRPQPRPQLRPRPTSIAHPPRFFQERVQITHGIRHRSPLSRRPS